MEDKADTFVQERLDSLHEIDCKIVSLLDDVSNLFQTYSESRSDPKDVKELFSKQTKSIYGTLSKVAIDLRKEVRFMDENIGVYDKNNDNVMILPISVDQKNTNLGRKKMDEQLGQLDKLLKNDNNEEAGKDE
ncbi:uncharacterized protein CANTADRAFT_45248 [Suhomyces tanzawaensis NRRL Y-17324]|uniref:Mediator of RNA polymerase II transcription subunit 11 n=1 Tax=Suhomyces tanzawaensis NRRL Y-17324 TaxID=984487 RepID=A0A1E4SRG2_9ASCO|nr:uncharacterized protein CANTADRAFT_45248 [Suhomyces tanzawaensis NRRL Y-17324]ODV82091.1 hypothetical protein CANTADRAFT_45248 [Suhomyces tanzawaensis NRRL Y-17324]